MIREISDMNKESYFRIKVLISTAFFFEKGFLNLLQNSQGNTFNYPVSFKKYFRTATL